MPLPPATDPSAGLPPTDPPAGAVTRRRLFFGLVVLLSWAAMTALLATVLRPGGFDAVDIAILVLFALYSPWLLVGFWNGFIGFAIMRLSLDPLGLTCPPARRITGDEPIGARTAIVLCIRNEEPARVFANASALLDEIARTPWADHFRLHVLSDTDQPAMAAAEEVAMRRLIASAEVPLAPTYRRRTHNVGFKAGNIRDFLLQAGDAAEFMLVLDADSRMSAERILRMVRIMERAPRLGILQSLAVGLPSSSPLARLFQFGMRLGMRSYTLGSAWWHADCGPYWGHNALLRIEPFKRHCELPTLPGREPLGGDILSHDQIEAVLMRRAGYEVRVLPEEGGSFEENPPTLVEHMRRDMRWCLGNMQYLRLLGMPRLQPASRFQLVLAIMMFLASPAYLAIWLLVLVQALRHRGGPAADWIAAGPGWWLLGIAVAMIFAPKIASAADVLLRRRGRASFGGATRFIAGLAFEAVFAFLVTPIAALSHTLMLAAITCGRGVGWSAQARGTHRVSWREAAARFWPHTLAGLAAAGGLAALSPAAILYGAPVYLGLLIAVPFTVATSSPVLGGAMVRIGLCATPEEIGSALQDVGADGHRGEAAPASTAAAPNVA